MPKKKKSASEIIELRRLKRQRKRTRRKIFILTLILIAIGIGVLFTPIFTLEYIEVSGISKLTEEEVVSASALQKGKNLFLFNVNNIAAAIDKIPYVDTVKVMRKIPNKFSIEIVECVPMAYIKIQNMVVPIDKYGKVLEKETDVKKYKIPVLNDIVVENYTVCEKIIANNQENFQKTLEIILNLYNNSFLEGVNSIYFENDEIMFKLNKEIRVRVGNTDQINSKISMIREVEKKLPPNAKGLIDVRNSEKAYFTRED